MKMMQNVCKMATALFGCVSIEAVCSGNELIVLILMLILILLVLILALFVFCCKPRTVEVTIRSKKSHKKRKKK